MRQADHRGELQIQEFCGFAHVFCKPGSYVCLIPMAAYAFVEALKRDAQNKNMAVILRKGSRAQARGTGHIITKDC
jgi:hypothetical protein